MAGCPTSRSFFARCGMPQASPSSLIRVPQLRRGAPCSHQRCPDFLLLSTNRYRVCGFLSKKAAWSCSTPRTSTGNPGYVGRKRRAKPTAAFSSELYASFLRNGTKRNGGLQFSSPGTHTPSLAPASADRSRVYPQQAARRDRSLCSMDAKRLLHFSERKRSISRITRSP
jgi:hypothetical protein